MKASQRGGNFAIYAVPGLAIGIAFAILLLGRGRSGLGARVFGGPPGPDGIAAWRVLAVERALGVEVPLRRTTLRLVAKQGDFESAIQGVTDEEGAWEARLPLGDQRGVLQVEVHTVGTEPRLIGANQVATSVPAWQGALHLDPLPIPGNVTGDLALTVSPLRGLLAAPYPEEVLVQVRDVARSEPVHAAAVSAQAQGIAFDSATEITTNSQGQVRLRLHATEHDAKLQLSARTVSGLQGTWSGNLPVQPGALWIDPVGSIDGQIRIQSPVGHRQVYVTSIDRTARLFSTRLSLEDDNGGGKGMVSIPKPPRTGWILVSPDPPGRETDAVAWPIPSPEGIARAAATIRTPLLLDGMPLVERAVRKQSLRTRVRAFTVLGAAALLEAALLWWRALNARDEISRALKGNPELQEALGASLSSGYRFWIRMVAGTAIIAFGFFSAALATYLGTR